MNHIIVKKVMNTYIYYGLSTIYEAVFIRNNENSNKQIKLEFN